jgi:hypothetical protein
MPQPAPKLLPVAKLVEFARTGPARTQSLYSRQSYPIPVRQEGGLRVAFLYCPHGRLDPAEGPHLLAPSHLAFLQAETGKFESIRQVTPADFGQPHQPGEDIGIHRMPAGLNVDTFYAEEDRLSRAYDVLLPAFAAGVTDYPPEVRKAAAEFRRLFPWLAEACLMPYYHTVGKEFFAWVNRIPESA